MWEMKACTAYRGQQGSHRLLQRCPLVYLHGCWSSLCEDRLLAASALMTCCAPATSPLIGL